MELIERQHEINAAGNEQMIEHTKQLMRAARELGISMVKVGNIEIHAYPMQQITVPAQTPAVPLDPALAQTQLSPEEQEEELLYAAS